ncbi:MAG: hypothetical protein A2754_02950 [Candidatus Magasanikbacteria bacterium RIFCSPHIGHO2_01_FULL_47_8]|uniref:Endolytic murein transglycosylase n=1 Tax=Candidatus Magasanikbacteria bacterium RIFCSPHIGHO2_01_FULL_47_8 TaxID=1798673 RepID=A0A1F6MDP7_9BACT|nr:MAG: hypothetical protein A2754_02950 [Candidatus Magasanikbacteria bacterium RIFCSPHIGHO2_01_FULL_47_8]
MDNKLIRVFLIAIIALDILAIAVLAFLVIFSNRPADASSAEKIPFKVESGWSAGDIAQSLEDSGIISKDIYFIFYVMWKGEAGQLKTGYYELSPSMSASQIVEELKTGKIRQVTVTIPEGTTTSDMENILREAGLEKIGENELVDAVSISPVYAYGVTGLKLFLDLPEAGNIDGFLFPDTYVFEPAAQLNTIAGKMFANFDEKVPDSVRVRIKADGRTLYNVVKMASLLEKEVQTFEDMRIVAGILEKRMEIGMPLQVDATLIYITGKKGSELTNADKLIDSPYNTYKYLGLPPTPINNPGLNAINAAIDPAKSDYLYYISTPDGKTIFAKTLEEHNANVAKYLR